MCGAKEDGGLSIIKKIQLWLFEGKNYTFFFGPSALNTQNRLEKIGFFELSRPRKSGVEVEIPKKRCFLPK